MTKVHAGFWGSVLLVALLALSMISPTFAAQPTSRTYSLKGEQVLVQCDGFDVIDFYDATIVQTDFYDKDGNFVAIHLSIHGTDTYQQSVTKEEITMPTHFMARIDRQAMQNTSAGLMYHLMIPGLGGVLLEVGRSVYDFTTDKFVFLAGQHQVSAGEMTDLCAAFAP